MRIGIIGCGLIGNKRADAARESHEVVAVADVLSQRARVLAERTGARVASDWREVVAADVDAVIVATRHDELSKISLAAVEAGKHVLVEKPAARNAEELRPVAAAAARSRRRVKVGFNHRFHPSFLKAHSIVESGVLGPLMFVRAHYGHGGRMGYEGEWRCQPELSGGGELVDQGTHLIDLARWFLGDLKLEYSSTPTYFWKIGVDDNCFLALRNAAGNMAWLHASWTEWKNGFEFEIAGRDGKLVVTGLGGSYGLERLTHYQMHPQMGPPETTIWEFPFPDRSWSAEFQNFADAISHDRQPWSNIDDALAIMRIVDQAYGRREST
jgi:predicted dehydrogenase